MYRPDVVTLKQFYSSALGQMMRRHLWRRLNGLWPAMPGETTLGLGYAVPFLPPSCGARDINVAMMPAEQGALYWPVGEDNRVVLAKDGTLPFADASCNRVLMMHHTEFDQNVHATMREVWRVLVPGGRLLVVAPNRQGAWAYTGATPLRAGQAFSGVQMRHRVALGGLTLLRVESALFFPPCTARWLLRIAAMLEWLGLLLLPQFGGVLLVEAEKQIYAAAGEAARERARPATQGLRPAYSPRLLQRIKHNLWR